MSVTSFLAASDARITPALVAFESAASTKVEKTNTGSAGDNIFSCVAKVASSIAAQLAGPGATNEHGADVLRQQHKDTENFALEEIENDNNKEPRNSPQIGVEATGALSTLDNETGLARSNWLELRARVQSVDPRVFAYEKDPKYLQQCAASKQRRASLTPSCPIWH